VLSVLANRRIEYDERWHLGSLTQSLDTIP
jgi:hypothetical protein